MDDVKPCLAIGKIRIIIDTFDYRTGTEAYNAEALRGVTIKRVLDNASLHTQTWLPSATDTQTDCLFLDLGELSLGELAQIPLRLKHSLVRALQHLCLSQSEDTILPPYDLTINPQSKETGYPIQSNGVYLYEQACDVLQTAQLMRSRPTFLLGMRALDFGGKENEQSSLRERTELLEKLVAACGMGVKPPHPETGIRLAAISLIYLLRQATGASWLSRRYPSRQFVNALVLAVANGEIPGDWVEHLFYLPHCADHTASVIQIWQLPLWRERPIREAAYKTIQARETLYGLELRFKDSANRGSLSLRQTRKGVQGQLDERQRDDMVAHSEHSVCNAGLVLLWPVLPELFEQLGLTIEHQFMDSDARWNAVSTLNWLTWGEEILSEDSFFCQLVCGLSIHSARTTPPQKSRLQRQEVDSWLGETCSRLPGWEKMSVHDIRQLWLQRRGIVRTADMITLYAKREPYDALMRNWPWNFSVMTLPWLASPITLEWCEFAI